MRERANKIEELKKQLKTYEELHQSMTQEEECTYRQSSSSPSPMPPDTRGFTAWCAPQQATPPVLPNEERYPVPYPDEPPFSRVQPQICPVPIAPQPGNSSRPATRHRMESWAPNTTQRTVTGLLTPAPSIPTPAPSLPTPAPIHQMDGPIKSDDMLPLTSADLSTAPYENYAFDMSGLGSPRRQSASLLHMAVAGNHIDTIKVLLQDDRVIIDEKDSEGYTPLQRAVMHGKTEIVKLLLEHSELPMEPVVGFGVPYSGV
jgi:hypothetical protein